MRTSLQQLFQLHENEVKLVAKPLLVATREHPITSNICVKSCIASVGTWSSYGGFFC